jgi:hypothetical protein
VDQQAHTFQFHSLIPGSYLLAASATSDDRTFYAQRTIEIGNAPPVPIELSLSGGMDLKGSIQADSQDHPPMEDAQIWLAPMEQSPGAYLPQSQAQIGKDNSFTLTGVMPGRFRVMTGVPGYVKSVSLGGQSVSPYGFEIGAGATGPLRVLIGSKMAEVSVTVTGAPADSTIYVMTFPDDPERLGASLEHISSSPGNSQIPVGSMPPGAYRLLATDLPNPWPLLQRPDLLQALQSRAQTVEVPDDGRVNVPIEIVSRDEILAAIEDKE